MEQIGRRAFMAGGVALGGAALAGAASARNGKESKPMKVVVLTGSPRKNGNTNTLAARFIEGAKAAGHEVFRSTRRKPRSALAAPATPAA